VFYCLIAALCCPTIPHTVPVPLLGLFVSIYMTESGTAVVWLL